MTQVHTVSQAGHVDLAEVQCGRHADAERALGNVISTVGHSNSQWTLSQQRGAIHTIPFNMMHNSQKNALLL